VTAWEAGRSALKYLLGNGDGDRDVQFALQGVSRATQAVKSNQQR
jgi:hypothetical protein